MGKCFVARVARLVTKIKNFFAKQNRGAIVEYVIVVVIIAIGALGWLKNIRNAINLKLNNTADTL